MASDSNVSGNDVRQLSVDELDQVVGGAGSQQQDQHRYDSVAGFDTSQLHLDAAAMSSGEAANEVANEVAAGHATVDQAMDLLMAVAAAENTSVTGALASFAGHVADPSVVGAELGELIKTGQIQATQAFSEINSAIGAHKLTGEEAVGLLTGLAGSSTAANVDREAGQQIAAMINQGRVDLDDAMDAMHGALSKVSYPTADAAQLLMAVAAHGKLDLQSAVGEEFQEIMSKQLAAGNEVSGLAALIDQHGSGLSIEQKMGVLGGAMSALLDDKKLTDDQVYSSVLSVSENRPERAMTLLLSVAVADDSMTQTKMGQALCSMITRGDIKAADAMDGITNAMKSQVITGDVAMSVLAGLAAQGLNTQHPEVLSTAVGEIGQLIGTTFTADQAVSALAVAGAEGNVKLQAAVGAVIAEMVEAHQIPAERLMTDLNGIIASKAITVQEAIGILAGMTAQGDAKVDAAVGSEIATLINNKQITAHQAIVEINKVVNDKVLTPDQAVTALLAVATVSDAPTRWMMGNEVGFLSNRSDYTPAQAMNAITAAVAANTISAAEAMQVLVGVAYDALATNNPQVQAAAVAEIKTLINAHHISGQEAVAALASAAQGSDSSTLRAAAAGEIAAIITSGHATAAQAMAGIDSAVAAKVLSADQAIRILAGVASETNAAVGTAVGSEIAALIASKHISAYDAILAIRGVANTDRLTPAQEFNVLFAVAAVSDAQTRVQMGHELGYRMWKDNVPTADAIREIHSAVTSNKISADEAVSMLIGVSYSTHTSKDASLNSAARAEIVTLIQGNFIAADKAAAAMIESGASVNSITQSYAVNGVMELMTSKHLTVEQAVSVMDPARGGSPEALVTILASRSLFSAELAAQATAQIKDLLDSKQVALDQAMAGIHRAIETRYLQGDRVFDMLSAIAAHGGAAAQAAVGEEIALLVRTNQFTAAGAIAEIHGSIASKALTVDQAMGMMVAAANAAGQYPSILTAVGNELAALISENRITAARAIADIHTAVVSNAMSGNFASDVLMALASEGKAAIQAAVANEIVALIGTNRVSATEVMADIDRAVGSKGLSGTEALDMLSAIAGKGNAAAQTAVGNEIAALVSQNRITPAQAMAEITSAVTSKSMTGDEAVMVLAGIAAKGGSAPLMAAAGAEVASLVADKHLSAAKAMADIHSAVTSKALTGVQAVALLNSVASEGSAALQVAVGTEFAALVNGKLLQSAQLVAEVDRAVGSKAMSADEAVSVLTSVAGKVDATSRATMLGEINTLISKGQITAAQAMDEITQAAAAKTVSGDQALALLMGIASKNPTQMAAMGSEVASLVAGGQMSAAHAMTSIHSAITAKTITASHAVAMLTGVASEGGGAVQAAVGGEIAALITAGMLTAKQAITDIDRAVTAKTLSGDEAVGVMASMLAKGGSTVQPLVQSEITSLVANQHITASQAATGVENAVTSGALTGQQAISMLASVGVPASVAVLAAAGGEIADLINSKQLTASKAMADIDRAVVSHAMTAEQAINMLSGIAAKGDGAIRTAVGGEIANLVLKNHITATDAMADITVAVAAKAMTVDHAIGVLAGITTGLSIYSPKPSAALLDSVGAEVAALVAQNRISAAQVMTDIHGAVMSNALPWTQALKMLNSIASNGDAALQTAVGGEVVALVSANRITVSGAIQEIARAVDSKVLSGEEALGVLAGMATNGNAAVQAAVDTKIYGMLAMKQITFDNIENAVASKMMSVSDAIGAMCYAAEKGLPALRTAAGGEIADLVAKHHITPAQAVAEITSAVASKTMTASNAIGVLAGISATADTALLTAVAGEVALLVADNRITGATAMSGLHNAITSKVLTADQAMAVLSSVASQGSLALQAEVGKEYVALVNSKVITNTQAIAAVHNALVSGSLAHDEAIGVLAGFATRSSPAVQASVGSEIASLISSKHITAAQWSADLNALVAGKVLTAAQMTTLQTAVSKARL